MKADPQHFHLAKEAAAGRAWARGMDRSFFGAGARLGKRLATIGAVAGLVSLAGCSLPEAQPDLTRFYLLTSSPAPAEKAEGPAATRVQLRAVIVPEFLRGKLMQVRLGENEVRFVDLARWAEPLEAGIGRVVRENLAKQARFEVVTGRASGHDFEIVLHLRACEGVVPGGTARLATRIEIVTGGLAANRVAQEDFVTEVPGWDGKDYADLARKLSEAAAALSERIAALVPVAE